MYLLTQISPFFSPDFSCELTSSQWFHQSLQLFHHQDIASSPRPCFLVYQCHNIWNKHKVEILNVNTNSNLFCCLNLSFGAIDLSTIKTVLAHCLIHSFLISAIWTYLCRNLRSFLVYLGIGVTHHSNQQVQQEDHEERHEYEPLYLSNCSMSGSIKCVPEISKLSQWHDEHLWSQNFFSILYFIINKPE